MKISIHSNGGKPLATIHNAEKLLDKFDNTQRILWSTIVETLRDKAREDIPVLAIPSEEIDLDPCPDCGEPRTMYIEKRGDSFVEVLECTYGLCDARTEREVWLCIDSESTLSTEAHNVEVIREKLASIKEIEEALGSDIYDTCHSVGLVGNVVLRETIVNLQRKMDNLRGLTRSIRMQIDLMLEKAERRISS